MEAQAAALSGATIIKRFISTCILMNLSTAVVSFSGPPLLPQLACKDGKCTRRVGPAGVQGRHLAVRRANSGRCGRSDRDATRMRSILFFFVVRCMLVAPHACAAKASVGLFWDDIGLLLAYLDPKLSNPGTESPRRARWGKLLRHGYTSRTFI